MCQATRIEKYLRKKYNGKEMDAYQIATESLINVVTVYNHLRYEKLKDRSFKQVAEYIAENY